MNRAKPIAKATWSTALRERACGMVNDLAKKLNEAVEQDKMSLLLDKKEKLALKKIGLLAQLEQIEKDLFSTNEELNNATVEVTTEIVA